MNNNIDIEMGTSIDICMNRGSTIYTDMTTNTSIGMHMGIMMVTWEWQEQHDGNMMLVKVVRYI